MQVPHSARLVFSPMSHADLDDMAAMLGDPNVMAYYPHPRSVTETQAWIDRNIARYEQHGYGLWIIRTTEGEFVGDCGLTWQPVNGRLVLEVGYHVRSDLQGQGYATEAAAACRQFAKGVAEHLVAIIHPRNAASIRVAEKIGLSYEEDDTAADLVRSVYGADL